MHETRYTLIQKLQKKELNDEEAWELFASTYESFIIAILIKLQINPEEARDLKQDILIKLWEKLPSFEYEPNRSKFRTWVYSITKNTAISHIRSQSSEQKRIERYFSEDESEKSSAFDKLFMQEWQLFISNKALERIKEDFTPQSLAIFKKCLAGADSAELAKEYDLQANSIVRIKNRVKEQLMLEITKLRTELE
jgi:RNA polymerase sigma-70 factor (ECF subfamily)